MSARSARTTRWQRVQRYRRTKKVAYRFLLEQLTPLPFKYHLPEMHQVLRWTFAQTTIMLHKQMVRVLDIETDTRGWP